MPAPLALHCMQQCHAWVPAAAISWHHEEESGNTMHTIKLEAQDGAHHSYHTHSAVLSLHMGQTADGRPLAACTYARCYLKEGQFVASQSLLHEAGKSSTNCQLADGQFTDCQSADCL